MSTHRIEIRMCRPAADGMWVRRPAAPYDMVGITWADLRAAARDYGDCLDETVSAWYGAVLAEARRLASAECGARVEVEGLYGSRRYSSRACAEAALPALRESWARSCRADYPSVPAGWVEQQIRVVELDPDQDRSARAAEAGASALDAEIRAAQEVQR